MITRIREFVIFVVLLSLGSVSLASGQAPNSQDATDQQHQLIEQMVMERMLLSAGSKMARIQQFGQRNAATIRQIGLANQAEIVQRGDDNDTYLLQQGNRNDARLSVLTDNSRFRLEQIGNDNEFAQTLTMPNVNHGLYRQVGDGNTMIESGVSSMPLQIEQRGNDMKAIIDHRSRR